MACISARGQKVRCGVPCVRVGTDQDGRALPVGDYERRSLDSLRKWRSARKVKQSRLGSGRTWRRRTAAKCVVSEIPALKVAAVGLGIRPQRALHEVSGTRDAIARIGIRLALCISGLGLFITFARRRRPGGSVQLRGWPLSVCCRGASTSVRLPLGSSSHLDVSWLGYQHGLRHQEWLRTRGPLTSLAAASRLPGAVGAGTQAHRRAAATEPGSSACGHR